MASVRSGDQPGGRVLTGRMVFAITASAFAVIIGVNVLMAYKAISTFPGLEVANSYVASQTFDAERKAQIALNWTLAQDYRPGVYRLTFTDGNGKPAPVRDVTATIGRSTEARDDVVPVFAEADGAFTAPVTLPRGKWMVLLYAHARDGTLFQKRLDLIVRD